MFKKLIVAVIAAQLTIIPVQAEMKQTKTQCTQAVFGIDDAVVLAVTSYLVVHFVGSFIKAWNKVSKERADAKAKQETQKPASNCQL